MRRIAYYDIDMMHFFKRLYDEQNNFDYEIPTFTEAFRL